MHRWICISYVHGVAARNATDLYEYAGATLCHYCQRRPACRRRVQASSGETITDHDLSTELEGYQHSTHMVG